VIRIPTPAGLAGICAVLAAVLPPAPSGAEAAAAPASPVAMGSRLEPFVDHWLIDRLDRTRLQLAAPQPAETVFTFDRPWEGTAVGYVTVIKDGPVYRLYYRGLPSSDVPDGTDLETTCYAESRDGIHWVRPNLNLFEVGGSRENNVVLAHQPPSSHNFSPLLDTAPGADPAARYKALALGKSGLLAFASPDGIHWRKLREEPVITSKTFAFDSQNVAFYSQAEGRYVCYFRTWRHDVRWISRCTSKDFLTWDEPVDMGYGDTPREHLYTNQTQPYFRAPHLYVATAARFMPGRRVITDDEMHRMGIAPTSWLKDDCSEVVLLTSRGGDRYDRTFMEAFIRPGLGPENWVSRSNYPALNIVQTGPAEMSLYVQRENGQKGHHLRRYTMRLDGFASVRAPYAGGEMITRPVVFTAPPGAPEPVRAEPAAPPPVAIDRDRPLNGKGSLRFTRPAVITLPGTRNLGGQATFAATLGGIPAGHRRLFSAYNGGAVDGGEFVLDFNSAADIEGGGAIQFLYAGGRVIAPLKAVGNWSSESGRPGPHHVAATFDSGAVTIYFDGKPVGHGSIPAGKRLEFSLGDLHLGEDYPPTPLDNEPLLGTIDDVLVLRRALSPEQVADLAARGPAALDRTREDGLLYTLEEQGADTIIDSLTHDGGQDAFLPRGPKPDVVRLLLNYSTAAAGSIRCELQDERGAGIPGYTLAECDEVVGDRISRPVSWQGRSELVAFAGKPVRLRFQMKDADLYAIQFAR
jgi:hypothetical protein